MNGIRPLLVRYRREIGESTKVVSGVSRQLSPLQIGDFSAWLGSIGRMVWFQAELKNRQRRLRCPCGPATRLPNWRKGVAVQRRGAQSL
jgi:hypothetical protein